MKKSLLFIFILTAYIGFAQCADPVITDFECATPSHPLVGAITTITNPFSTGINTSATIGQFSDDGTAPFDNLSVNFGAPIDLSINSILHVKVYTELATPKPFIAKLEGGTNTLEIATTITVSDVWVEYTFDFSSVATQGNTTLVLFFNAFQTDGAVGDIYYIDDLFFAPPPTTCNDPILTDFECNNPSQPITGALTRIANPVSGGINTSAFVGQYIDNETDSFDNIAVNYTVPIDLSVNNVLKVKIYAPTTVPLLVKLENGTSAPIELGSLGTNGDNIDIANQWKEYAFDFSSQAAANHQRLVLFINAGNTGSMSQTFYVDDIRWDNTTTLSVNAVETENTVSLYPNPTTDVLHLSSSNQIDSYQILDISGRKIVSNTEKIIANTIPVHHLKTGVYFLTLRSGSTNEVFKFIKK